MKILEDIYYTSYNHPRQSLDVHLPDQDKFPVFVYFHGGGITAGSKKQGWIPYLVEKGIAVVSCNYRLYPEAAYPDFLKDAAAAVAWAYNHMAEYGEVQGLFVGGSSAGGYITQMLAFDKKYLGIHKIDSDMLAGYVMDAGQPTAHFNVLRERGIDTRRVIIDETAPIYHITRNREYAPMQVIVAENDMMNRAEQTALMISTLKHMGCPEDKIDYRLVSGCKHVEYLKVFDDKGDNLFAKMVSEFILDNTKKGVARIQ